MPCADLEHRGAAQRLVLADLGDVVGQLFLDRAAARILGGAEGLDVGALLQRELRDVADEILEDLVLGDEVRFRVDLDDRAALAFDGDADEAL